MIIIVDGPKCCGKTNLCNKLAAKFGGKIVHFPTNSPTGSKAMTMLKSQPSSSEYDMCQDLMEQDIDSVIFQLDDSDLWILDRSFISNSVYRNTERITIKQKYQNILDKCLLIIILASDDNLLTWSGARKEKPLSDIEKTKLVWSGNRFRLVSKILGCEPISGSSCIINIHPGRTVITRTG